MAITLTDFTQGIIMLTGSVLMIAVLLGKVRGISMAITGAVKTVVIVLLILSASMSTLSSLVLVSASSVAIDLYKGHVNPNISQKNSLLLMRVLSGLFVIISFLIALFQFDVIAFTKRPKESQLMKAFQDSCPGR